MWGGGRLGAGARAVAPRLCPCRGSSGVRNGLLVVQMLLEEPRGLAEQLWGCELAAVLRSCWRDGQGSDCPDAALALGVMKRLAERQLPPGTAGSVGAAEPPALGGSAAGCRLRAEHGAGSCRASAGAGPTCPCRGRQRGPSGAGRAAAAAGWPGGRCPVEGRGGGPGAAAVRCWQRPLRAAVAAAAGAQKLQAAAAQPGAAGSREGCEPGRAQVGAEASEGALGPPQHGRESRAGGAAGGCGACLWVPLGLCFSRGRGTSAALV